MVSDTTIAYRHSGRRSRLLSLCSGEFDDVLACFKFFSFDFQWESILVWCPFDTGTVQMWNSQVSSILPQKHDTINYPNIHINRSKHRSRTTSCNCCTSWGAINREIKPVVRRKVERFWGWIPIWIWELNRSPKMGFASYMGVIARSLCSAVKVDRRHGTVWWYPCGRNCYFVKNSGSSRCPVTSQDGSRWLVITQDGSQWHVIIQGGSRWPVIF